MKTIENNITTLEGFKDAHYGKIGTEKRDALEEGYKSFRIGVMLHQARIKKGMTQQELAEKVGTTKSYISKIENNLKEVKLSTLKKIVEQGLGGKIELSVVI